MVAREANPNRHGRGEEAKAFLTMLRARAVAAWHRGGEEGGGHGILSTGLLASPFQSSTGYRGKWAGGLMCLRYLFLERSFKKPPVVAHSCASEFILQTFSGALPFVYVQVLVVSSVVLTSSRRSRAPPKRARPQRGYET